MRVTIVCDLCRQPLTVPKDGNGKHRFDSHYKATLSFFNTDRLFSRTGFRAKGYEERADICAPCWIERIKPLLEAFGVRFETETLDGESDLELIHAPDPWPRKKIEL